MKIILIDYGAGNLGSVANALAEISEFEIKISSDASDLKSASHIILPGVGAFGDCMQGLKTKGDLLQELRKQIIVEKKPFLGICVGMQVLASNGYENGEHLGLGLINGAVEKIATHNIATDGTQQILKVPHMGWNELSVKPNDHPVLKGIKSGDHFYFANSYHFVVRNENHVLAFVEYGTKINAILAKDNIIATQFHPEKSGALGLSLLKNFVSWHP